LPPTASDPARRRGQTAAAMPTELLPKHDSSRIASSFGFFFFPARLAAALLLLLQ
jgi:hypothetical protein